MPKVIVFVTPNGKRMKPRQLIFEDSSDESEEHDSRKNLPILYVTDSKGKERVWKCWVIGDTVYREYGLVDGKQVESQRTFKGKSIGKKNETSPEEQAWAEANKEWVKHIDKEYAPAEDDKEGQKLLSKVVSAKKETGGHNINAGAAAGARGKKTISRNKKATCMVETIEGGVVIPMKAQVWELEDEKNPHSVQQKVAKYFSKTTGRGKSLKLESTEFYGQAKLDGWRARIMIQPSSDNDYEVVITSNNGKQFPWFSSLRQIIVEWLSSSNIDPSDILDGLDGELFAMELYNTDGSFVPEEARFSTISSICGVARSNPHELEDQIQFHIFDLIDKTGKITQKQRFEHLDNLFEHLPKSASTRICRVPTEIISSVEDVPAFHDRFSDMGYEGVVLRTFNNLYKPGKRNTEMRKFKHFIDNEYQIKGCKVNEGVSEEHFVWILESDDGQEFSAKPRGTRDEKKMWYKNRKNFVGKWLTVRFQEYSDDGIPRFPVAKCFREGRGIDA